MDRSSIWICAQSSTARSVENRAEALVFIVVIMTSTFGSTGRIFREFAHMSQLFCTCTANAIPRCTKRGPDHRLLFNVTNNSEIVMNEAAHHRVDSFAAKEPYRALSYCAVARELTTTRWEFQVCVSLSKRMIDKRR
jgi:hypothetical protein